MKKYAKCEIDQAREYFHGQGFQEESAMLDKRAFTYFVLPQAIEPNLPDFVYRCTGDPSDGYVFGISDSVRKDFRKYAVCHEFIEFTEIGLETQGRCRNALSEELGLVPEGIKPEYISMRKNFFANLLDYCSKQPDNYTQADIDEFKGTLSELNQHSIRI